MAPSLAAYLAPKLVVVHVGERRNAVNFRTLGWIDGMSWTADEPPPMTATCGTVHEFSLEVFQAWNIGVFPGIEDPGTTDEDIAVVLKLSAISTGDLQRILSSFLIPGRRLYNRPELNVSLEVVFGRNVFEILPDLLRRRVVMRPIRISGPSKLIRM